MPNESDAIAWLCQKKEIWMCGVSDCSDFDRNKQALGRVLKDEAYVPEHMFEPNEWNQILATLDVCVNEVTPTKFCDENGYDIVPYFMLSPILESENEERDWETQMEQTKTKQTLLIQEEIPVLGEQ